MLKPKVFGDTRGFFIEVWNREICRETALDIDFAQDNHSSFSKHVLCGFQYQAIATAQAMLLWATTDNVFDVLVDLRESSPTYGILDGYLLNTENHDCFLVPPGCVHGFLVLSNVADFNYKLSISYRPDMKRSLLWNDSDHAIDWPIEIGLEPIVSSTDTAAATFNDCDNDD